MAYVNVNNGLCFKRSNAVYDISDLHATCDTCSHIHLEQSEYNDDRPSDVNIDLDYHFHKNVHTNSTVTVINHWCAMSNRLYILMFEV